MKNIAIHLIVLFWGFCLFSSKSGAAEYYQFGPLSAVVDKSGQLVSIQDKNITRITFDYSLQLVYVHDANGSVIAQQPIDSAVWGISGGSSYAFNKVKAEIQSLVTANGMVVQNYSQQVFDPYPCFLSPCPSGYTPGPNPWFTPINNIPDVDLGVSDDPLLDHIPQALLDYDRSRWESWRQDQCDVAHSLWTGLEVMGSAGLTVFACFTAETGIGAVACVAAAGVWAAALARARAADANCHSTYPGFSEW